MNKLLNAFFRKFLIALCFTLTAAGQQSKNEEIEKKLADYFLAERENIHVHLDKNTFFTTEDIWFKGYVYDRKKELPFFATVNVFANIIGPDGKVVDSALFYANLGRFSGNLKPDKNLPSGKYYIQFYTNWMNNFTEDDSFIQEITIINPLKNPENAFPKPAASLKIQINPEGGTYLKGVINNFGISVKDCRNNPIAITEASVIDSKGTVIKTVALNKLGYGKFDLPQNAPDGLKAVVVFNGKQHEQALPLPQLKGIALEVNNYNLTDKTLFKIRSNDLTSKELAGKPLKIIIHKDDKAVFYDLVLKEAGIEQSFIVLNSELPDGLNTIRILDNNLNQLAERLMYKYPKTSLHATLAEEKRTAQSILYKGSVTHPNMELSICILPENTLALTPYNDIYSTFLLGAYIENQEGIAGKYYFNNLSRTNQYELDIFLLNSKNKVSWNNIRNSPPKLNYTFDRGLTLKGTVNNTIKDPKKYKVKTTSITGMMDEISEIGDNNEFLLDNLILADSTQLNFALIEKGIMKQELKIYPQVFNNNRQYNKQYKPQAPACPVADAATTPGNAVTALPDIPLYKKEAITLDEVVINAKKKELKFEKSFGNSTLRGFKFEEDDPLGSILLLDYIRQNGFVVVNDGVSVSISNRTVTSISAGKSTPQVFMDNIEMMDVEALRSVKLMDVDELYLSTTAIVPSVRNKMGIIKIYMRRKFSNNKAVLGHTNFMVKNGFKKINPFQNADYISTSDKGFENFGLIDWEDVVTTDEKGAFKIEVPNTGHKTVKVLIEGFSADGKLISEIITVTSK